MKNNTKLAIFIVAVALMAAVLGSCSKAVVDTSSIYGSWKEVGITQPDRATGEDKVYTLKEFAEMYEYDRPIEPMNLTFREDGTLDLFEKLQGEVGKLEETGDGEYQIVNTFDILDGQKIDDPMEMVALFILKDGQLFMTMEYRQKGEIIDQSESYMVFDKVK